MADILQTMYIKIFTEFQTKLLFLFEFHFACSYTSNQKVTTGSVNGQAPKNYIHYDDVIMTTMASQITSLTVVNSTVYSDADQRKHQSSASLAFVWGIHRGPVNSPHKGPVTRKMFPFDDVIMHFTDAVESPGLNVLNCRGGVTYICVNKSCHYRSR